MSTSNINRKEDRSRLIRRFLDTETEAEEEKLLADYFRHHDADEDEREVALLLNIVSRMKAPETFPVEENIEKEYESIIQAHTTKRRRLTISLWATAVAACISVCIVLAVFLDKKGNVSSGQLIAGKEIEEQSGEILFTEETENMVDFLRLISEYPFSESESLEMYLVGDASVIATYDANNILKTYLAINSEEDGSILLLAMGI